MKKFVFNVEAYEEMDGVNLTVCLGKRDDDTYQVDIEINSDKHSLEHRHIRWYFAVDHKDLALHKKMNEIKTFLYERMSRTDKYSYHRMIDIILDFIKPKEQNYA